MVFSACRAQFNVIAIVVKNTSCGQRGVILYFRLPQGWAVVSEDDQFPFALPDHFQSLLVPIALIGTFHVL